MSLTLVETEQLSNPFQCPLCWRLFYFENDYANHKCIASKSKIKSGGKKK